MMASEPRARTRPVTAAFWTLSRTPNEVFWLLLDCSCEAAEADLLALELLEVLPAALADEAAEVDVELGTAEEEDEATTAAEEVLKGPLPMTNEVFFLGSSLSSAFWYHWASQRSGMFLRWVQKS